MQETVIIVAGGSGSRMQSVLPKQFVEINGLPVIMHAIKQFYEYNKDIEIRVVLPGSQIIFWNELVSNYDFKISCKVYTGGKTRFHSVKNGLSNIGSNTLVAVHDGVRPFVSIDTIKKTFQIAVLKGSAIPVIEIHETVRLINTDSSKTVNRDEYRLVQTPQVFHSSVLLAAYKQSYNESFTDDASVVEAFGHTITLVEGNRENIKITTPVDLLVAEAYIGKGS